MNNTRLKQLQAQKDEILCEFTRKVTQANEEFRLKMGALNKEEERTRMLCAEAEKLAIDIYWEDDDDKAYTNPYRNGELVTNYEVRTGGCSCHRNEPKPLYLEMWIETLYGRIYLAPIHLGERTWDSRSETPSYRLDQDSESLMDELPSDLPEEIRKEILDKIQEMRES